MKIHQLRYFRLPTIHPVLLVNAAPPPGESGPGDKEFGVCRRNP
jgi:hypothetical protein